MLRQSLLHLLRSYSAKFPAEVSTINQFISFVEANTNCFERSLQEGHVTASAWVINHDGSAVLLIHHLKLDKWLQPGGHCDGDPDTLHVATKECFEETGLQTEPVTTEIFDVDIHEIPQRKDIPAHLHYDVRYLLQANPDAQIAASETETNNVLWVPLNKVASYTTEDSVLRMLAKTAAYR
jgi:8-oxo-dGTP pyrophosphatase MutT (NUDIX family)